MNYYVGIDIGKYHHVTRVVNETGEQIDKSLRFAATATGWQEFVTHLNNSIDDIDYHSLHVGFEATGHYWFTLYLKCKELGMRVSVLNPLEVKAFRNEGIRGNKTDGIDAYKIAKLIRFGDFRETHIPTGDLLALRQLTRMRGDLVVMIGQLKQKSVAILDSVFPEYRTLFSNIFGTSSTALLSQASTPEAISVLPTDKVTALLRKASRGRFGLKKAQEIHNTAAQSIGMLLGLDAFSLSLEILLGQIDHLQTQVDRLGKEIATRVRKLNTTLTTIPGIAEVTAGVILSEIGEFSRFISKDGAEKLVALAGLDPKLKESGTYKGKSKMSKRGSPYLRHAVRQAAFIAVTVVKDPMFTKIYQKHISRGKHMEVALSHVARKIIHVIYSLLKSNKKYVPIT